MHDNRVILKEDRVMLVTERDGDITAGNNEGYGLYLSDTRFLSGFTLRINRLRPVLLSGDGSGHANTIQLVNPALPYGDGIIPRQSISIRRTRFLYHGFHERVSVQNCTSDPIEVALTFEFDADFKDIFDVRQVAVLPMLGHTRPVRATQNGLLLSYEGLDGLRRTTDIILNPAPTRQRARSVSYQLRLEGHATETVMLDVIPREENEPDQDHRHFDVAVDALAASYDAWSRDCAEITTDNETLNQVLRQSVTDLRVLVNNYDTGLFPSAGIPWFAVPFGRDGAITGAQTLMLNPDIARGVLRFLAKYQGRHNDRSREEEPGKIMHEIRTGELARLRQIPHTPYYGAIDSTPLFLMLLAELMRWDWDLELFRELEPAVRLALGWIDDLGDADGDGFIEYRAQARFGIRNQSWKDSHDSLTHLNGKQAPVPAAPIEVQAYVHAAWQGLAPLFKAIGDHGTASRLRQQAADLRHRLHSAYWIDREGFYAQALDRDGLPVETVSSNPGHCLWAESLSAAHARRVGKRLLAPDMYSGWGVRTLSTTAPSYNPMSYHNGSVWPHDNSIIADGLRRYGMDGYASTLIDSCLAGAMRLPDRRLPELFCGFERDARFDSRPAEYIVAGRPQAWASAAIPHLVQSALGLRPDANRNALHLAPIRSRHYRRISVKGLRLGRNRVSFDVHWVDGASRVTVVDNPGKVKLERVPAA